MRIAIVILVSLLLHAGFVVAGLVYFPHSINQFTTSQIVPLEFIDDIVPITNLPEEEIEEEFVEEEAPPPVPEEETIPETPPDTPPEPEIDQEAVEDVPPAVETRPEQTPDPQPQPEAPPQTPTARTSPPQRQEDSLNDLLGDLASVVDEERASASSNNRNRGASSREAIGITLADSIRSQAQRCWRSSADAPDPERLIVVIRVRLSRDGSLDGQPDVFNRQAIDVSGDRYWRVARDRALAAIIDCAPYRLPAEHFSEWRRIDVTFRAED